MTVRRRAPRSAWAIPVALGMALGGVAAGCSDEGDKDAFCERLGETQSLGDVFGTLDPSDPGGTQERLRSARDSFRELEAEAPGEIRADIARLRQGFDLVLAAVEENPDDIPAAREAVADDIDQLSGLSQAGSAVVAYANTECSVDLTGG